MSVCYYGDCRETLKTLPGQSVQCCITSPPYFGLRDYGHADQIGLEPSPEAYVAELVAVFREVRRVLRDDGTLWLNLGDSYGQSINRNTIGGDKKHGLHGNLPSVCESGLKPKNLIGIPWRVAFALQADGWYLRQDIIWAKPNPMPESVTDRCTKAHEYLFLLSKSQRYYFDGEAISEPVAESTVARLSQLTLAEQSGSARVPGKINGNMKAAPPRFGGAKYGDSDAEAHRTKSGNEYGIGDGRRNRRSVWTVATQPFSGSHFAVMPPDLVKPCVLAGCPVGGVVLDPFFGSGTVGMVAESLGRQWIGCELNEQYRPLIEQRTAQMGLVLKGGTA